MSQREDPRHNLRLTPELHKRLKLAAVENERSMNAEITVRLERSFEPEPLTALAEALRPLAKLSDGDRARAGELLIEFGSLLAKSGKS